MNPSPRAANSAGKTLPNAVAFDLSTARRMLPLVRTIVFDIRAGQSSLNRLNPEQDRLDRNRRALTWAERDRRYQIADEIRKTEKNLTLAAVELDDLGVSIVDGVAGSVEFPTRINGRSAAFSWQYEEETINFWHYQGERQRRPIPVEWNAQTPVSV